LKHFNKVILVYVLLMPFVMVILFAGALWAADITPLAGITVDDQHPNGCVDCHVKVNDEKDYRIPAELKHVEKHPPIEKIVKIVPNDCLKCHKEGTKPGAFNQVIHKVHFSNPKENHFVAHYNGDCLNCHTLNMNTYKMSVKSGPANW